MKEKVIISFTRTHADYDTAMAAFSAGTSHTVRDHSTLDHEISYGVSITTDDGLYYVGGSTAEGKGDQVLLVKADNAAEITVDTVNELPFTFFDGFVALKDVELYIGAGKWTDRHKFQLPIFDACSIKVDKSNPGMYHKTCYFAKYHFVLDRNGVLLLGEVRS